MDIGEPEEIVEVEAPSFPEHVPERQAPEREKPREPVPA